MSNDWYFAYRPQSHPCRDCKERTPYCHGDCEKYKKFKKEYERNKYDTPKR